MEHSNEACIRGFTGSNEIRDEGRYRPEMVTLRAGLRPKWSDFKFERTDFWLVRANFGPEMADFRPEKAEFWA